MRSQLFCLNIAYFLGFINEYDLSTMSVVLHGCSHVDVVVNHARGCPALYSSGRKNERHELLGYCLLGVDWVAVRRCPHKSGVIREPPEVGPERLL